MPPEKATTPKSSPKKRSASSPSLPSQEVRFAWACFKSTRQNVDYDAVARLCGCTRNAARFRFYRMRDTFQDMVLLDSEDEPKESTPRSSPIKKTDQKKDPIKEKPEEIEIKLEDLDEA